VSIVVWSVLPRVASAELYKYVDKNCHLAYKDDKGSITDEIRSKAAQRDKKLANKSPLTQEVGPEGEDQAAEQEKKPATWASNQVWGHAWVKPIMIGVAFIVLFLVIGKISRAVGHRQIGSLLLVGLTVAVLVCLLYSYLDFINKAYTEIKTGAVRTQEQINKRNEVINEINQGEPKEEKR
jgi:hypothetical protein